MLEAQAAQPNRNVRPAWEGDTGTMTRSTSTAHDVARMAFAIAAHGGTSPEVEANLVRARARLREVAAILRLDLTPPDLAPIAPTPAPVAQAPAPVAPKPATVARTARTTTADASADPAQALADILARPPTSNVVARKMRAQNGAKFAYNAGLISLLEAEAIYKRAHKDADGAMSDLLLLVSTTPQPAYVPTYERLGRDRKALAPVAAPSDFEAGDVEPVAVAQELLDLA
jgi:hypothetical protein